jgi:lipid II:glycine glycyltransferase (peptidoglycan interpeptide bridge formation enzyme)
MPGAHLWAAVDEEGRVYSSAIFLESLDIVTYHLSGTPDAEIEAGGAKVIIDGVIAWAKEHDKTWINLGGGLRADKDDPLFTFKKGFSKLRLPFKVARWEVK